MSEEDDYEEIEYIVTTEVTITSGAPVYRWRVYVNDRKVREGYCYWAKKAQRKVGRKARRLSRDLELGVKPW